MESFIDEKIKNVKELNYQKTLIEKGWVSFDDLPPEFDSRVAVYFKNGCKLVMDWTKINKASLKWEPKFWKKL